MTEQATGPEPHERDEELEELSGRFEAVSKMLGFEETGAIGEARADFVRGITVDGRYDPENAVHQGLLRAYQDAAEASHGGTLEPEKIIGRQLAQVRLWFDIDNPDLFFRDLYGSQDNGGVVIALQQTPSLEAYLAEVLGIVDDLNMLNRNIN